MVCREHLEQRVNARQDVIIDSPESSYAEGLIQSVYLVDAHCARAIEHSHCLGIVPILVIQWVVPEGCAARRSSYKIRKRVIERVFLDNEDDKVRAGREGP